MKIIKTKLPISNEEQLTLADKLNFGATIFIEGKNTIGIVRVVGSEFYYDTYTSDAEYDEETLNFFNDCMDGGICQLGDAYDAITHHLEQQMELD